MNTIDWNSLIPDLKDWNNGKGIDPESWVGCEGNFRLATAYSLIFWPEFVEMDGMIFREGMDRFTLNSWLTACDGNKSSVEAVANHLHIQYIHLSCPDASPERFVYLGNVLKQIYAAKLAAEFPDRRFVVEFYEPPDQNLGEYQITFYQRHDS
ncbi:MAG: hypothetical protein LBE62_06345 [Azonexus sp.]|jgi:hypothetical protein|nr:hypothetical protein [Azonexus sp.]